MSSSEQTGQSEEIHSPDEWANVVLTLTIPAAWAVLHGGDFMLAQGSADDIEPAEERCVAKDLLGRTSALRPHGGNHGFLRIYQLGLRFG
jgi:hypothetical protein